MAAITFHPRSAAVHHKGVPDYELVARLVDSLAAPVILTGGLSDAAQVREAFELTGAAAVMLARGALGNPWLFAQLVHGRELRPDARGGPVRARLDDRARRRAPRRAARHALPAQVLPLVCDPSAAGGEGGQAPAGIPADGAHAGARAGAAGPGLPAFRAGRLSPSREGSRPRYTAALAEAPGPATSPLAAGFCVLRTGPPTAIEGHMPKDVILTPEGLQKLKDELELLSTEKRREVAERIKEAQRVRGHLRELRVRRRQERAGDGREPHRPAAGEAADGDRHPGQGPLDRRRAGRLGRARQGREDGQVGEVHDRRLGRGQARTSTSCPTSRPWAAP